MIDGIVGAVSVQIQSLRTAKTHRAHADGVHLGEAALLRVVVAVDGVVEAGCGRPIVGGEAPVGCDSGFRTQRGAEWQSYLLEGIRVLPVCDQARAQSIRMVILNELAARTVRRQSRK